MWLLVEINVISLLLLQILAVNENYQYSRMRILVSGQLPPSPPPEENCPRLGLEFWSRLGLILGLGGNQTIAPEEKFPR